MRVIVVVICVVVYIASFFFDVTQFGFTDKIAMGNITYSFIHNETLHLLFNLLSFWILHGVLKKTFNSEVFAFFIPFAIAIATSLVSPYSLPTIGLSGVIFAQFGVAYYYNPKGFMPAFIGLLIANIAYFVRGMNVNIFLHASCFASGLLISYCYDSRKKSTT